MSRGMPDDEPGGQVAPWRSDVATREEQKRLEWKAIGATDDGYLLAEADCSPNGVLVIPRGTSEKDAARIRRRFAGTDAGARTDDNAIAMWVDTVRREYGEVLKATGVPPALVEVETPIVPDRLRAPIMSSLRGDGIASIGDRVGKSVFTFHSEPIDDDDPIEPAPPDPFADVARRLATARHREATAREASRNNGPALHDHRRAVVRSQLRRALCVVAVAVVAVYLLALTGMPMPVVIALAGAVVGVVDHAGGRPMVAARLFLNPDPGEWSAVCEAYEDAAVELYAAEIADGVARMLAAAGWDEPDVDQDEPPRQLEAGSDG